MSESESCRAELRTGDRGRLWPCLGTASSSAGEAAHDAASSSKMRTPGRLLDNGAASLLCFFFFFLDLFFSAVKHALARPKCQYPQAIFLLTSAACHVS